MCNNDECYPNHELIKNYMTDKFEFQTQQNNELFPTKLRMRKDKTLRQYKQVIKELYEALTQVTNQNQRMKIQIEKFVEKQNQRVGLGKIQQNKQQGLLERNKYMEVEMNKLSKYIQEYKVQLAKNQEKIRILQKNNREFQDKIQIYCQKIKDHEKLNELNIEKIRILQQALQTAIDQNKQIRFQVYNANRLNEGQLKDLREFQQQIKRKFQTLQISSPSYAEHHDRTDKHFDFKIEHLGRQTRSFSTQKKAKRNVGCLSSNKNLHKITNRQNIMYQQSQSIRPFEISLNNPQLGSQLQNLKKQIAQQYTLLSLKNQTYSKQRVHKTLESLKRRMGKVVKNVQDSQSQSCVDY